jgi:hypothetical protein
MPGGQLVFHVQNYLCNSAAGRRIDYVLSTLQANLRGGGEYGVEWRNAGSKANKQNVFNDFQVRAELFDLEKSITSCMCIAVLHQKQPIVGTCPMQ